MIRLVESFTYKLKDDRESKKPTVFEIKALTKTEIKKFQKELKKADSDKGEKNIDVIGNIIGSCIIKISGVEDNEGKEMSISPAEFYEKAPMEMINELIEIIFSGLDSSKIKN